MNNKENYLKIPLDKLQSIRVLLSRLFRDNNLHKDIELLLFYIYQDWNIVKETIELWREIENN